MKKILAMLFACTFMFAAAGCGGSSDSGTGGSGEQAPNTLGAKYQDPEDEAPAAPAEGEAPAAQ